MKVWSERAQEIAFLLNPAFCGRILYSTIKTYANNSHRALPFPLIYLVLPLVLHKSTREKINSRTQLLVWIQKYPELLIDFPQRARDLVPITNETLEFLADRKDRIDTKWRSRYCWFAENFKQNKILG